MIDRRVLEEVAAKHFEEMAVPSGVSLILHLFSGDRYTVNGFAEFLETICVVKVYPEDLGEETPRNHEGLLIFDRILLPYQAIAYVTITGREPERRSTVGFGGTS